MVIIVPNSQEMLTKPGKVIIFPMWFYLPLLDLNIQFLPIFSLICLYLPLFTPYLAFHLSQGERRRLTIHIIGLYHTIQNVCPSPGSVTATYPWICHCYIPMDLSLLHTPGSVTATYPWICHCYIPLDLSLLHTHGSVTATYPWICHCYIPLDLSLLHTPGSVTVT